MHGKEDRSISCLASDERKELEAALRISVIGYDHTILTNYL